MWSKCLTKFGYWYYVVIRSFYGRPSITAIFVFVDRARWLTLRVFVVSPTLQAEVIMCPLEKVHTVVTDENIDESPTLLTCCCFSTKVWPYQSVRNGLQTNGLTPIKAPVSFLQRSLFNSNRLWQNVFMRTPTILWLLPVITVHQQRYPFLFTTVNELLWLTY